MITCRRLPWHVRMAAASRMADELPRNDLEQVSPKGTPYLIGVEDACLELYNVADFPPALGRDRTAREEAVEVAGLRKALFT